MEKEFVTYELALRMKQLGFDEPCFGFYDGWDNNKAIGGNYPCDGINSAPTFSQVFRWFREKHDLYTNVTRYKDESEDKFLYYIDNGDIEEEFSNYEEADLACLEKLIEIVEEKNKEDETN